MPICQCHEPPGEFDCPPNSMPFCRAEDGKCVGQCYVPDEDIHGTPLLNWALSIIKNEERHAEQNVSNADMAILQEGRYAQKTGFDEEVIVTFDITSLEGLQGMNLFESAGV